MEKWLILWQEIYKVGLENLVVPTNKQMLRRKKNKKQKIMGGCQRDTGVYW
jgi:hypothetical protein